MTVAICLRCGLRKVGALTLCLGCGFEPVEPVDQAKSIMLSDHNLNEERLEAASQSLQTGHSVHFDEEQLTNMAEVLREDRPADWGCQVLLWTPVVVMVILLLLGVAVLLRPWTGWP